MPRTNDIYSVPPGTDGVPNTTISSTAYNRFVHDVETDLNTPRPVIAGGTGANNAADARINLGITDQINASIVPQCGRLYYNTSSQLVFAPFNGDKIKIQGTVYSIPSSAMLVPNANVHVDSVAGRSLAADTVYLLTLFNNSGTLAPDFLTNLAHSADTTAGNVGVETSTSNRSRTVIGLVRTWSSAAFVNTTAVRGVLNWFNRRNLNLRGATTNGAGTSAGSPTELNSNSRVYFLTWGDDDVTAGITGAFLSTAAGTGGWQIALDGAPLGVVSNQSVSSASHWGACSTSEPFNTSEAMHYISPFGAGYGVTMNFYVAAVGMIRG
jgi:hypothetical protein